MPCVWLPVLTCRGIASDLVAGEDPGSSLIAEAPAQYRPRHPEQTEFYQLFEDHFDSYVRGYEERFEPRAGPLRPVVVRSVEQFLSCGRLQGVFARIRCPSGGQVGPRRRRGHMRVLAARAPTRTPNDSLFSEQPLMRRGAPHEA